MEVLASNSFLRDVNVFHTAYYPTELMLYFEKHHIFEILFDLMIMLDQKRPDNVQEFIAGNINKVADKYRKINISVEFPLNYDLKKIAKVCSRVHQSPIIAMQKPASRKRLKKLAEQLKQFGLERANLIFFGTKGEIPEKQISEEFHLNRLIDITKSLKAEQHPNIQTILPIAVDFKNTIKQLSSIPGHKQIKYVERILMTGRPGSGKHLQARLLANRLDLILVSVNDLIKRARSDRNFFKKTLEIGLGDNVHTSELIATVVQKRLLEPDCLQFGWVLVDYPNTAEDVENLYHLLIVPQRVVHLHTDARLCWKRKRNHILKNNSQSEMKGAMLRAEFDYFDIHHLAMMAALEKQACVVVDINGNNSTEGVHEDILIKLMKI
ncbi:uncharacterized protein LOC135713379 [Ochlerotatus camptorhynchus]|uniref:uncharacterized protein LOC135713379 n=1 Tax=Ochlerotatus camptorhynchus TaxID=644619 RepID=UPI0031CE55E5